MVKVKDLKEVITTFLDKIGDEEKNGRYLSFEYCYKFFNDNYQTNDEKVKNLMTLYLYAYLASWGMLRNSFLLYKDYLFNKPIVEILCNAKKEKWNTLDIVEAIREYYTGETYYKEEKRVVIEKKSVTDTLVSKIIMGTLGAIPAYDRFFDFSACRLGISKTLNNNSLKALEKFIEINQTDINIIKEQTRQKCAFEYPDMKIVDMYFWQKAYDLSPVTRIMDELKNRQHTEEEKKKKIGELLDSSGRWKQKLKDNIDLKNFPDNKQGIRKVCDNIINEYYKTNIQEEKI